MLSAGVVRHGKIMLQRRLIRGDQQCEHATQSRFATLLVQFVDLRLNVPVVIEDDPNATAVTGVYLTRSDGVLSLERPSTDDGIAVQNVPGQSPQTISVPARTLEECLSEELGRLYPDEIYAEVVTQGWDLINPKR